MPPPQAQSTPVARAIASLEKAVSTISDNLESRCVPNHAGVAEVGEIAAIAEHLARTVKALQDVKALCQS